MSEYILEIKNFVKNARGLNNAKAAADKWFLSKSNAKDETAIVKDNSRFMPGKIYVFKYKSKPNKESETQQAPVYNAVVLSLGHKDGFDIGIDLNYLPDKEKLSLLSFLYKSFGKKILAAENSKPISAKSQRPIKEFNEELLVKLAGKMGIEYAIRKYETSERKGTFLLSYESWKYIPLLNLNKGNASLIKIQKAFPAYLKKKRKQLQKEKSGKSKYITNKNNK